MTRAQLKQRLMEQNLAQKERELEMREIDLVARELHILIFASNMSHNQPPQPNKRKGNSCFVRGTPKKLTHKSNLKVMI